MGIDEGVELAHQAAAQAPDALGSSVVPSGGRRGPLFELAAVLVDPDEVGLDHLQVTAIAPRYGLEDAIHLHRAAEAVGAGRGRPAALGDVGQASRSAEASNAVHPEADGPKRPVSKPRFGQTESAPHDSGILF